MLKPKSPEKAQNDAVDSNTTQNAMALAQNGTAKSNGFLNKMANLTTQLGNSVSNQVTGSLDAAVQKGNKAINYVADTSSTLSKNTKKGVATVTDKVGDVCGKFEIKDKLFVLLDLIDVKIVAAALYKIPAPPPAKIALVAIAQVLLILNNHRKNKNNPEKTEEAKQELATVLKNIDLKSAIQTLEKYKQSVPYGAQVVFILKLFIKA